MRPRIPAAIAVVLAVGSCAISCAPSQAATEAALRPSFSPNRLGASTTLTVAVTLLAGQGEGPEALPPPLSGMVLHLPAGLQVNLRGLAACSPARLQALGARGCPPGSSLGRGHSLVIVHPASQTIEESATLSVFRAPKRHGRPAIAILSQGYTPLYQRSVIIGVLQPDAAPYAAKLVLSIPPIPTLRFEPDASTATLSLSIGGLGRSTARAPGAIVEPGSCGAGGFRFAADFAFADGTAARATAGAHCP